MLSGLNLSQPTPQPDERGAVVLHRQRNKQWRTAQGRLDACIILGNKPWDTSAGTLIAREAGAQVIDLDGIDHSVTSSSTIAVAPSIEHELLAVIHNALVNDPTNE